MTLTVVSTPEEGGDVAVEPAGESGKYYPTDNVTLSAVARPGYVFVSWTGDVSEIEDASQATIVVSLNRYYAQNTDEVDIGANFARQESFPWKWLGIGLGGGLVVVAALGMMLLRLRASRPPAQT